MQTFTTDDQIFEALGPFSQPPSEEYTELIAAYDKAYPLSLNPARLTLLNNYSNYMNPAVPSYNPTAAQVLLADALASDQPKVDYVIDCEWGQSSAGTVQAMRRFAYMYTSGPAIDEPLVVPPSGSIKFTLIPPPAYVKK